MDSARLGGAHEFSALMPSGNVSAQLMTRAAALLKSAGRMTPDQLARCRRSTRPGGAGRSAEAVMAGKAMFDPHTSSFPVA